MPYVLYGIILIALIILVRNIRIVPQAQAYVITRLGAYKTTWGVGLHLKIPFIESVAKRLSLKEQVADFPPQPVITKDNSFLAASCISFRVRSILFCICAFVMY